MASSHVLSRMVAKEAVRHEVALARFLETVAESPDAFVKSIEIVRFRQEIHKKYQKQGVEAVCQEQRPQSEEVPQVHPSKACPLLQSSKATAEQRRVCL
mmetsp:Transcript_14800/g.35070  ORF Transcript_14800/g.35070 Transcript_14800/m.35070 type:complete len:99 (-) Transcript_14800:131-427(-)|eukprot:CAMPEP_0181484208 /NCGR_PEP_ID=MMETSP1110-20121109/45857_1 /TAXON_ID=174948 /ORGANISM="Symbiodinium sp., Strain CCMP421" /LENGTH=98 /DNA_ID=CAMNT_0023610021 /DNA_START=71 /DNA_END=367 /DNA_ORIENTATION=-